jgi:two-component system, NtrC family, nitrogen regulation sensor histidine kinase NtrY
MKMRLPSFSSQIIFIVVFFMAASVFISRQFFLGNISSYQEQLTALSTEENIRSIYYNYATKIDTNLEASFKRDINEILMGINKMEVAGELYEKNITRFSLSLFLMILLVGGVLLFYFLKLITKPLARLLDATDHIKLGNFDLNVQESPFSPLNNLIVSFNKMGYELEEGRRKLIETEKESLWRGMAQIMAHEIKNPLTPIRLSAQRVVMKYATQSEDFGEVLHKSVGIIEEEVDNLQALVNSFSGFAKMPSATLKPFNLNDQINEIISAYTEECNLHLDLDANLNLVCGDQRQLRQVWVNLIQNGIQAGEDKVIDIYIKSSNYDKDLIEFSIRDTGKGIPKEKLEKVFEPYFTTKKKGTGLGLAIVQRIIQNHNGSIEVKSNSKDGTIFTVLLPKSNLDIDGEKE